MCKNKYLNFYENKYMKELNKLELTLWKKKWWRKERINLDKFFLKKKKEEIKVLEKIVHTQRIIMKL